MSEPKLTPPNQAIEEIKAILEKYDLAGNVLVQSADEAAFLYKIDPSWSCAFFEERGGETILRLRAKASDYQSAEAKKRAITETTGMIMSFHSAALRDSSMFSGVIKLLAGHFDIRHWERLN